MTSKNCKIERRDFVWTLNNVKNYPGGEIERVIFEAGNPRHSLYYLKLYIDVTNAGKQLWSYKLVFMKGSYRKGYLTCKVRVVGEEGKLQPLPIFDPRSKNRQVLEEKFYVQGSITLRCRLTFPKESSEYTANVRDMSDKMCTLMDTKEFSDLVICAGGEEFHVHKFLLRQRCPEFFENLEINGDTPVKLDVSTPVLRAVLQYVYTGKYENLPMKNLQEFHDMAKKLGFEELTNEIVPAKVHVNLCSNVKVIKRMVYFNVSATEAVLGNVPFIKPVLFDSARFFIEVFLRMVDAGIWVDIGIRSFVQLENPILLNCVSSIGVDKNAMKYSPEVKLQFFPEDKNTERLVSSSFFRNKNLQKSNRLLIGLSMVFSKDTITTPCSVEDLDLDVESALCPDSPSIFGMGLLCRDLNELCYRTQAAEDGDVTLLFEDGKLRAHRAMLAVSSPVFHKMFLTDMTEKNNGEVEIQGIDIECAKRLLEYIYSREVIKNSYESDLEFLSAVDRYHVSHYFDKPSALLVSHLSVTRAGDVLVEAYRRHNERLKKEVVEYICLQRTVIMNSSHWASLSRKHPELELVSMFLQSTSRVCCGICEYMKRKPDDFYMAKYVLGKLY